MRGGTLFSGIGAPECAMPWVDWRWSAEIDPFASAVHAAHFPGIPNLGDVNAIDGAAIEPVDLVVFGSPCQSFSVAGKREGMDDPRGNMALVGLRVVGRVRPRWMVWENVPGVLSSDGGRDFGAFLGLLGELGYGFAYRVLDAQHFGVPQRRRRVFVVGCLGDWRGAAAVLFEPESLRGDSPPSREAGQRVALPVTGRVDRGGEHREAHGNNLIAFSAKDHGADHGDIAPTPRAGTHDKSHANAGVMPAIAFGGNRQSGPIEVATAVNAHGGPHGRLDFESETFVCGAIGAENVRHTTGMESGGGYADRPHPPRRWLRRQRGRNRERDAADPDSRGWQGQFVARSGANGAGFGRDGDPLCTLDTTGAQAITFDPTARHPEWAVGRPLKTDGPLAVQQGMSVRRILPVECERLQGLPDDWTAIAYRGKPAADGPRYRAIGNSMAVPVMRWIGERIRQFEEMPVLREAAD